MAASGTESLASTLPPPSPLPPLLSVSLQRYKLILTGRGVVLELKAKGEGPREHGLGVGEGR